ncbi:MAG: proline--tRNA ligase [Lentisphaerae bacterium]|mgnify:CR=1 FL=1|jgi:prolyl-tRNA synthetase|nr:proline--tRNA ligase [Lentisphaerota bacterium]MBT4823082.1 proline--tRNA ligase [Lentisphaerota bacterium]MBT5609772.1 proline--tRNA ligase [Lentisphaerota bacterium]MBT7062271.1 proline--tRNA ligase [Lentisphaerota bacterium]MBT7844575.1 proline--tRNA ligase [Lentisphaerota bacterium]
MRLSQLVGQRLKDAPRDAQTASHIFLIRGGYCRPVSTGIYSLLPLGKRITRKIEAIIREEMDRIDGQEVLMPVVLPEELWEESGRAGSVGPELLRFQDRNGKPMLLGMTHEEAVVHLTRTEVTSYKQLPCMLYQIQTKYRDEARPRAGLIRVREFTMKDAYSFHVDQECLEAYYDRAHEAYVRIFERVGLGNCVSIESDTGMMGGAVSHEFMAVADCGEDTIFMSPNREYKANREIAVSKVACCQDAPLPLEKVHTPGQTTIEEVAGFLDLAPDQTGKAVFYTAPDGNLVFVMIRGDIEVNETKLRNFLGVSELVFANDEEIRAIGAEPGYASILDIDAEKVRVVVDPSAAESSNLVVGANEADYHFKNFNFARDAACGEVVDIATVRAGDPCPVTGEPLDMCRGIEVGNIFQLGTKYSGAMGCNYLDKNGKSQSMVMGCYGIGVGRTMAAVVEQSHDDYGPVWPMSIAPYHVHICSLNPKKEGVAETADGLYRELQARGIEVLYDDRGEKAGFAFNDADLIGIPLRLIVSPKTVAAGQVEFKRRDSRDRELIDREAVVDMIADLVRQG